MSTDDLTTLCDAYNLNEAEAAQVVLDNYLLDCDSVMSVERKDMLIDAMRVLCPSSKYSQREKSDELRT